MLLRSQYYNSPIDTFACGCIMAELFTLRPIFPGSSEADQIYKICSIMGSPTMRTWPDGIKLAAQMNFRFPQFVPTSLSTIIPNASKEAIDLMNGLLAFDPNKVRRSRRGRLTCARVRVLSYLRFSVFLPFF